MGHGVPVVKVLVKVAVSKRVVVCVYLAYKSKSRNTVHTVVREVIEAELIYCDLHSQALLKLPWSQMLMT